MKLLMVSVGEGRYAVPADIVTQILDPALEGDFRVERSEAVYRGERLPVLDLHAVAGEPHGVARVYLVVEAARSRAIVAVDGADSICDVPSTAIAPLPPFIFMRSARVFRGVFSDGGQPRLLLNQDGFL